MISTIVAFWVLMLALNLLITARVYRMTLTTGAWYDQAEAEARSFEAHFKAYLAGNSGRNRRKLAKLAIPFFQRMFRKHYSKPIARGKIRIRFEREESCLTQSPQAQVEPLEIAYRGKKHHAKRYSSETLPLRQRRPAQRLRRHKARKAKKHTRTGGLGKRRNGGRRQSKR